MRWIGLSLVFATALLAGCRNAPADERDNLRHEVETTDDTNHDEMRAKLRRILVGDSESRRNGDPHYRATAAMGLGDLGDPVDAEVLRDVLLGPLSDENIQVRMEAAIALGKLNYAGPRDERRLDTVESLRQRIAFERDDSNRPLETEFLVRSAMLNSLIAIGGRSAAVAIHDVANRIHRDLSDLEASLFTSATDRGLLDRCFEGLAILTDTLDVEAAANRVATDSLDDHLTWWAGQIAAMPEE